MDEIEVCVNDIVAQYGHLTLGGETQAQDFKKTVQNFIEYGPGIVQTYEGLGSSL